VSGATTTALDSRLGEIDRNGSCVIEGLIPAERCAEIRRRVAAVVAREGHRYSPPKAIGFVPGVINHEQSFVPHLADERLLELVETLLGRHVRISFTSAIVNLPGNARGDWHADWPFNQRNAGHVPTPYPDAVMHVTTLWMLSPFTKENGGTLVLPGSHRRRTNPTGADCDIDPQQVLDGEQHVVGTAGSVLVMDSRLWHATAPNRTDEPRVALAVRYAPWWLNLEVLRPGSEQRKQMVDEPGESDNEVPAVPRKVFERLPQKVKPLYRHWLAHEAGP
jgi:hypothetical protein